MNLSLFLFSIIFVHQHISVNSFCDYRYRNGWSAYEDNFQCFCGPKNEPHVEGKICCASFECLRKNWCKDSFFLPSSDLGKDFCRSSNPQMYYNIPDNCSDLSVVKFCDGRLENQCIQEYCSGPAEDFPVFDKATKTACIGHASENGQNNFYCGTRMGSRYQNNQCYQTEANSTNKYKCINRLDISETYLRTTPTFDKKVSSPRWNFFKTFQTNDTHIWCGNETRKKECSDITVWLQPPTFNCEKEGISVSNRDICFAIDFVEEKYNEQQGKNYHSHENFVLKRKFQNSDFISNN